jgi:hypothetical protein
MVTAPKNNESEVAILDIRNAINELGLKELITNGSPKSSEKLKQFDIGKYRICEHTPVLLVYNGLTKKIDNLKKIEKTAKKYGWNHYTLAKLYTLANEKQEGYSLFITSVSFCQEDLRLGVRNNKSIADRIEEM